MVKSPQLLLLKRSIAGLVPTALIKDVVHSLFEENQ